MIGLPIRSRQAERREATRQEIIAAAWEVAHETSLSGLTLRAVAARVGMQAPSLYSHFDSKNAIYDAMFEQGWRDYIKLIGAMRLPDDPRETLLVMTQTYFDFATSDLARHQLMDVRTIPDFTPSERAYAAAVDCYEQMRAELIRIGVRRDADIDVYTALISGLVAQQLANDPGGDRWRRLLPRVIHLFADDLGLPRPRSDKKGTGR